MVYHSLLRPQGGGRRVKNHVKLFLKISRSWTRCKKPHRNILLLDRVMNFWKLHFMGNYSARKIFKWPYLKITKGTFIWTFYMVGTWNLVCSFPVCHLTNLVEGFWKFWFLAILWLENCQKWRPYWIFGQFSSHKMAENQNF